MKTTLFSFDALSDNALLAEVRRLAARERSATARLIASLAELDARKLYLVEGCSSLFVYCTRVLHLSEHAAYGRIEAARLARRFPEVLEGLDEGSLTLTNLALLASHLTEENHTALIDAIRGKSKRQTEQLAAALRPQPPVAPAIRKLPEPRTAFAACVATHPAPPHAEPVPAVLMPAPSAPIRPAVVQPLAPERFKVQFTVSRETHDKLRRAQDVLRHSIPNGDIALIFDRALTLLLTNVEKRKLAAADRPRASNAGAGRARYIPASVKREVWQRDGGRCAFVGTRGRCEERGFLEFHHVEPYAAGGATTAANVELRCRAHNAYEAQVFFGSTQPGFVRERQAVYVLEPIEGEDATIFSSEPGRNAPLSRH